MDHKEESFVEWGQKTRSFVNIDNTRTFYKTYQQEQNLISEAWPFLALLKLNPCVLLNTSVK